MVGLKARAINNASMSKRAGEKTAPVGATH